MLTPAEQRRIAESIRRIAQEIDQIQIAAHAPCDGCLAKRTSWPGRSSCTFTTASASAVRTAHRVVVVLGR